MRYVIARSHIDKREIAYRVFVTESLALIPQNKFLTSKYIDLVKPREVDTRTGDEVALDVITKIGLKFKEGEEDGRIQPKCEVDS